MNTDQAEAWNSGEDMAHWIDNQARAALAPYADAGGVHLDAAVWLVQAVAPA